MKSTILKNRGPFANREFRHIIECQCMSDWHYLTFSYDREDRMIDVQFTSNYNAPLWFKIKAAIKYIFKKENFPMGDCLLIDEFNIEDLEMLIKDLKKFKDK